MAEYEDDQDLENDENSIDEPKSKDRAWVRDLERKAHEGKQAVKDAATATARAAELERQLALRDAGIDLTSPQGKFFAENYNGDISVDAIKAKASEIGLIAQSENPEIKQELAALDRVANASSGSASAQTLTEFEELDAVKFGDVDAVLALIQKAGSSISRDDDFTWKEPESKYTGR
jgi:hypothetical protein